MLYYFLSHCLLDYWQQPKAHKVQALYMPHICEPNAKITLCGAGTEWKTDIDGQKRCVVAPECTTEYVEICNQPTAAEVATRYQDAGQCGEGTRNDIEICGEGTFWDGDECHNPNVYGCMVQSDPGYNPLATIDDGSCLETRYGCMVLAACNYDVSAGYPNDELCEFLDCME